MCSTGNNTSTVKLHVHTWRMTQWPSFDATSRALSATTSWPYMCAQITPVQHILKLGLQYSTYVPNSRDNIYITCPNETLWKLPWSSVKPSLRPTASTSFRGSTPGLSTKNTGVAGPVSLYDSSNGIVLFSTYLRPSCSSTYSLYWRENVVNNVRVLQFTTLNVW